jgi:hypothetical protein
MVVRVLVDGDLALLQAQDRAIRFEATVSVGRRDPDGGGAVVPITDKIPGSSVHGEPTSAIPTILEERGINTLSDRE